MNNNIINKTMDLSDLETDDAQVVITEINNLILLLKSKNLKISSWYGTFDLNESPNKFEIINRGYNYKPLQFSVDDCNFPWFLYWEIFWIIKNIRIKPGDKILDLGGNSSLFSYYLAHKGYDVTTIDLQKELTDNSNKVSKEMKWNLKSYTMDMKNLSFNYKFDHITSICVFEHIPMYDRVQINRKIKDHLADNGTFSITIDYKNPSLYASIDSEDDIFNQFIVPSGLKLRENQKFFDNELRYMLHPFYYKNINFIYKLKCVLRNEFSKTQLFKYKNYNDYTFAALFMQNN